MTRVRGSVAVVTGAASGIGRGIAEELAATGASVVVADISLEKAAATAREIGATAAHVDVAELASVERLADTVLEQHGRVDIVVNNAGVGPSGDLAQMTIADWRWLIDVNLFGVIHGVTVFLPLLESNPHGGHLVNTSSMSAFAPMPGLGGYAVTKAGVSALTEVLQRELLESGSRVHATVLAPGPVDTAIADSMRHRDPQPATGLTRFEPSAAARRIMITPRESGRIVREAIENDAPYAITHPQLWPRVEERYAEHRRAFGA
ncbi:SDR family oxidoreductase [Okibacterium endophyticum]